MKAADKIAERAESAINSLRSIGEGAEPIEMALALAAAGNMIADAIATGEAAFVGFRSQVIASAMLTVEDLKG